jgi:sarcosine oxidase subunit gamma
MVEEGPALCRFILRGRPVAGFGTALPTVPRGVAEADGRGALWLGPDEWLLLAPPEEAPGVEAALAGADSLVEVSDAFVALRVVGARAARQLSAGCPLDLHPAAFPPGTATRTLMGRAGVVLWRQEPEVWHLEVGRSFAAYVRGFLAEAGRGLPDI